MAPTTEANRSARKRSSTVGQLFQLIWEKKAWWLVPMVSVFLVLGMLLFMTAGSALSPFIYALF
jgi:hypothetical protein